MKTRFLSNVGGTVFLTMSLASVLGAVTLEHTPAATGATRVLLLAQGPDRILLDSLTGVPLPAPSLDPVTTAAGGTLV